MTEEYTIKHIGMGRHDFVICTTDGTTMFLSKEYNMIPQAGDKVTLVLDEHEDTQILCMHINDKLIYDTRKG